MSSILVNPYGMWRDTNGVLYFTERLNYCTRKIDTNGLIQNVAGVCGTQGNSTDGGMATASALKYPVNVITDSTGVVYIADELSYKVRKVLTDGTIKTFAGNGAAGSTTGVQATSVGIGNPLGLWISSVGQIFLSVATTTRYLNMVSSDGTLIRVAGKYFTVCVVRWLMECCSCRHNHWAEQRWVCSHQYQV